jgi:hypothetical protein
MARNRWRHRRVVLAAALAALAATPGAGAAEARVPRDAPVVAGPTASGGRIVAFDRGQRLCTAFLGPRDRRRWAYPECGRPRPRLRQVGLSSSGYPHRQFHYGLVPPEVAEAELVFRDGNTARGSASTGPAYTGRYAGKVRFLLVERRVRRRFALPDEAYIRLFDANGDLLAIATDFFQPVRTRPAKELRRGMTRGAAWSLRAFGERSLVPVPGNEERFVTEPCVEVWRRGPTRTDRDFGGEDRSLAKACLDADNARDRDAYDVQQHCGRIGIAAVGIVEPEVRAVIAVLGDGRTRRALLTRLPGGYRGGKAFALAVPRNVALRRLVELTETGGRSVLDDGQGPGAIRCGDLGFAAIFYGEEPRPPTGPVALTAYDDGPLICVTLGRPTDSPGECRHPPVDPLYSWILERRAGRSRFVAGVVPADVTRVVVQLANGTRIPVDTATSPYTGQYSGRIRFFTVQLPRRARISEFRLYDMLGRRVETLPSGDGFRPAGPGRLVVPGAPGLRLHARRYGSRSAFDGYLCIRLGGGRCGFGFGDTVNLRAQCDPRRLVLWGLLPGHSSTFTVETDMGAFAARVARLPRALRDDLRGTPRYVRRFAAAFAFVAVVPARAHPTALVISGRRTSTRRLRLPSAAEQCGYDDFLA